MQAMAKKRVFISFDYDHDLDLKNLLVGQAKNEDSPFEIIDFSIKEAISEDWKKKVRIRIDFIGLYSYRENSLPVIIPELLNTVRDRNWLVHNYNPPFGNFDKNYIYT